MPLPYPKQLLFSSSYSYCTKTISRGSRMLFSTMVVDPTWKNSEERWGHFGDKNVCAFKEKTKGKSFLLEDPNTRHVKTQAWGAWLSAPPHCSMEGTARTPHRVTLGTLLHVPAQHPGEASGLGRSGFPAKYPTTRPLRKITQSVHNQSRKFLCLQLLGGRYKSLFSLYSILLFKKMLSCFLQLYPQQAVRSEIEFASPEKK